MANTINGNNRESIAYEVNDMRIGLYYKSQSFRDKILSQNIGKYSLFKELMTPAIGEAYDIYHNAKKRPIPIGGNGLLGYTHSNNNSYGIMLNERYGRDGYVNAYHVGPGKPVMAYRDWDTDYDDYISKCINLFGYSSLVDEWINSRAFTNPESELTDDTDTKNYRQLRQERLYDAMRIAMTPVLFDTVGVVDTYQIEDALMGFSLTKNPQEKNKDSQLGLVGSRIAGITLDRAANFNDFRRGKYITLEHENTYGLTTLNEDWIISKYSSLNLLNAIRYNDLDRWNYLSNLENVDNFEDFQVDKENFHYSDDLRLDRNIFHHSDTLRLDALKRNKANPSNAGRFFHYYALNDDGHSVTSGFIERGLYSPQTYESHGDSSYIVGSQTKYLYNEHDKSNGHGTSIDNTSYRSIEDLTEIFLDDVDVSGDKEEELSQSSLLKKTNELFKDNKIGSLISRFHTNNDTDNEHNHITPLQNAVSTWGMSRGRNLLKKDPTTHSNYDNPYCRVWTKHHQYSRMTHLIRPFVENEQDFKGVDAIHTAIGESLRPNGAPERMSRWSTLRENGLPRISPNHERKSKDDLTNYMFSIENLAWKDILVDKHLSKEQIGPNNGRIMWFPPYNLKFTENVSANWNGNEFIGRGEKIYTYTNTERSGTLNFTVLVDHPSIINAWKNNVGDNGFSNDENEEAILRFFAGCEIPEDVRGKAQIEIDGQLIDKTDITPNTDPIESPDAKEINFFVFYPNNYSGRDFDYSQQRNTASMNTMEKNKKKPLATPPFNDQVEPMTYLFCGEGTDAGNTKLKYNSSMSGFSGYEMVVGNHPGLAKTGPMVENANQINVDKNKNWYYRVDESTRQQSLYPESYYDTYSFGLNSSTADLRSRIYGLKQLIPETMPEDTIYSFGEVYAAIIRNGSEEKLIENLKIEDDELDCRRRIVALRILLANLADYKIKVEIIGNANTNNEKGQSLGDGHEAQVRNNTLADFRAQTIKKWLMYNIKSLKDDDISISYQVLDPTKCEQDEYCIKPNGAEQSLINQFNSKVYRSASVKLTFIPIKDKISIPSSVMSSDIITEKLDGIELKNFPATKKIQTLINKEFLTEEQEKKKKKIDRIIEKRNKKEARSSFKAAKKFLKSEEYTNSILADIDAYIDGEDILNKQMLEELIEGETNNILNSINNDKDDYKLQMIAKYGLKGYEALTGIVDLSDFVDDFDTEALQREIDDEFTKNVISKIKVRRISKDDNTYDNEYTYFKEVSASDNLIRKYITDKVKYFDPAFHSITPEGFNSRLTFLHQCTRQGPTISVSEKSGLDAAPARNLAFGRPPVCVLRIGDFYNTKIIINSMSIDYGDNQLDLNPEGIGIQPMLANVSLNFNFLGGSDLSGPIDRLQNAISYNYYANTSVYDKRADYRSPEYSNTDKKNGTTLGNVNTYDFFPREDNKK